MGKGRRRWREAACNLQQQPGILRSPPGSCGSGSMVIRPTWGNARDGPGWDYSGAGDQIVQRGMSSRRNINATLSPTKAYVALIGSQALAGLTSVAVSLLDSSAAT